MGEIDGGAVTWRIFDPVGELYAVDLGQGLGPRDQSSVVCDILHLDLAGSIQPCDGQRTEPFQRLGQGQGPRRERAGSRPDSSVYT